MKIHHLDELRVFAQIVESGSLAAAAKALALPATTVSRRLAQLEQRLDTQLIYRSTRSLTVSDAGHILLKSARIVLDELAHVESALEQETKGLNGVVRISVLSLLSEDLLDVVGPLMEQHPALRVEVHVADRSVNPIAAGVDVAIYGGTLSDSSLIAQKLMNVELILAAHENYLARRGTPRKLKDLEEHDVLAFAGGGGNWTFTDKNRKQHSMHLSGRLTANDGRTLRDGISGGLGIGLTSTRVMKKNKSLRRVLPSYSLAPVPLYAVYPAAMGRSTRLRTIVEYLNEALVKASRNHS